jgi:DNA (cytosine-5)-methyltransferase 1
MKQNFLYTEGGGLNIGFKVAKEAANASIRMLLLDGFAGMGGVTGSAKRVKIDDNPAIKVIIAINHDPNAIKNHMLNHPDTAHFMEDFREVSMKEVSDVIEFWKLIHPDALIAAWISAECTHISWARGGTSRDADSRTLSNEIFRYIEALNPDYIFIENVVEIMSWGPLKIRAKAHHKADASNGVYANTELKFTFNKKTNQEEYHWEPYEKKNGQYFQEWKNTIIGYGYNYDYRILDSANFGAYTSRERYFAIFAKPGLPIEFPKATHTRNAYANDLFSECLSRWKAVKDVLDLTNQGYSIFYKKENMSIPARNRRNTCDKSFERYFDGLINHVCGGKSEYERRKQFLIVYHGSGPKSYSIERPATTIPTNDSLGVVTCEFYLDKQYKGEHNHQSVNRPAGAVLTTDKHRLITVERLLYNPAWFGHFLSVERPAPVIVAGQNKAPISIISILKGENVVIPVYADDSPACIKLKELMAMYSITDIKMRMLTIPELLSIMGFDPNLKLVGSQEVIKKGIGNAVEGVIGTAILQSSVNSLDGTFRSQAA